jgi:hypothetical protein
MNISATKRMPFTTVIEALAAACGLDESVIPPGSPGLMLESTGGLLTLVRPHPGNGALLAVDIEAVDVSDAADGRIDPTVAERALGAIFELGGALEETSHWRLGLDSDYQFVLTAAFEISAFADTEHALAAIEDGVGRARALRAAWEGLLAGARA